MRAILPERTEERRPESPPKQSANWPAAWPAHRAQPSTGGFAPARGDPARLTSYPHRRGELVAGNVDVSGGSVFGSFGVPGEGWVFTALGALLRYDHRRNRSRVGVLRNLLRTEPATMLAKDHHPG